MTDGEITLEWAAYGRPAYDSLRAAVSAAKAGDPLAPVTLVMPTDLSGVIARRALARGFDDNHDGVAALTVLTVARLAELVGAPSLVATGRRPLASPVLAAAWRQVVADDPGVFGPVADHPSTITALAAAHRTLRDLDHEHLDALSGAGSVVADVVRLHREVVGRCSDRWYDATQLYEVAAGEFDDRAAASLGQVILFLPQDLTRAQGRFLQRVSSLAPVHVIAGTTGDDRADEAVRASVRLLGAETDPAPVPSPTATQVAHASDSDDEVRLVVRDLVDRLATTPAHRIAVLHGHSSPYARTLHEQLLAAGVPINGPGVRPTAERTLPRAFAALLEALDSDALDRATLFDLLSSAPFRRADGTRVPASRWARVARTAGVTTVDTWHDRLTRLSSAERAAAEDLESDDPDWLRERHIRTADDADELLGYVDSLQAAGAEGAAATTWSTLAAWASALLEQCFGDEAARAKAPDADRRASERLGQLIASLADLDQVEETADLDALRQVLALELADDVGRVGVYGTGVLVAPLSSAVGLDHDVVYVVGLAEGLCPTPVDDDPLLPDAARELVRPALPATRDRLDRQHRHLLAALASAPTVVASFPRGDLRSSGGRIPSRWLLPTLRELSGQPALAASRWDLASGDWLLESPSYAATVTSTPAPATEQEWRQRALAAGARTTVDADARYARNVELARDRASTRFTRFDGNLSAHAQDMPDLADGVRAHSPTSLESWASCPHAYFVRRVLRVEPVEDPDSVLEITPAERGNLMHAALDEFFSTLPDGAPAGTTPWADEQRALLQEIGGRCADDAEARGLTGHPTLWARSRAEILSHLDLLLTQDDEVRAAYGREQIHAELRFGRDTPAVEVALTDERTILMQGSVDRIDTNPAGLAVVDYKSGSATKFLDTERSGDPFVHGTKLQLPVYGYAARAERGLPASPVRAEYWFIGRRDRGRRIGYEITTEIEDKYAVVLTTIVDGIAGGVFPEHPPERTSWGAGWVECPYCDVDGLGSDDARRRWERKRSDAALTGYVALAEPDSGAGGGAA